MTASWLGKRGGLIIGAAKGSHHAEKIFGHGPKKEGIRFVGLKLWMPVPKSLVN